MIKTCYVCGKEVERRNNTSIPSICFTCKKKRNKTRALVRAEQDDILTKECKKCAQCGRVLTVPSWKYCDNPTCISKRQKIQYKRNYDNRVIKKYLAEKAKDHTLDHKKAEDITSIRSSESVKYALEPR